MVICSICSFGESPNWGWFYMSIISTSETALDPHTNHLVARKWWPLIDLSNWYVLGNSYRETVDQASPPSTILAQDVAQNVVTFPWRRLSWHILQKMTDSDNRVICHTSLKGLLSFTFAHKSWPHLWGPLISSKDMRLPSYPYSKNTCAQIVRSVFRRRETPWCDCC